MQNHRKDTEYTDTHINTVLKKAQQRMYFLHQLRKYNLPQDLLSMFYTAVIESVLCTSITVWFGSATKLIGTDSNGQSGLQKRSSVPTCPPSKTCTPPESGNGQEKSLQTPHTPDTNYSNSSPLVDATDHCSPKPPDTKTVSSPSPSHKINS